MGGNAKMMGAENEEKNEAVGEAVCVSQNEFRRGLYGSRHKAKLQR